MEDKPYIVYLTPDEFDELHGSYENFVEWCHKDMDTRQRELAERVLAKLQQADAEHVCVDEETVSPDVSNEVPITSIIRADLLSAGYSEAVVANLTDSDMQQIASALEDVYCDHGYWVDLDLSKRTLEHKEEDAVLEHDDDRSGDADGLT